MEVALAFGRVDVDGLLDEIDHEQFLEWAAFVALRPTGWQAMNLAAARVAFVIAQTQSKKKLRERDFLVRLGGGGGTNPATERARMEAFAIRGAIERGEKHHG